LISRKVYKPIPLKWVIWGVKMASPKGVETLSENEKDTILNEIRKAVKQAVDRLNKDRSGLYRFKLDDVEIIYKSDGKADLYVSVYYVAEFSDYTDKVDEINANYSLPLFAEIRSMINEHLEGAGELVIRTYPVKCNTNKCSVGLWIMTYLADASVEFLKQKAGAIWLIIYYAIDSITKLALI